MVEKDPCSFEMETNKKNFKKYPNVCNIQHLYPNSTSFGFCLSPDEGDGSKKVYPFRCSDLSQVPYRVGL